MTVLITGAAGQVGRELAEQAALRGIEHIALSSAELDITNAAAVEMAFAKYKPTLVINAAAYTAVDKAESEKEKAFTVNAEGVRNLAQSARQAGCPVFHISTDYVFDGSKKEPYSETDQPNPTSVYGSSKLEGERYLQAILPEHRILRVSWVFGQYGNNFVKTMLRLGAERDVLRIVNDQFGAPTSAAAIATVLLDWAEAFLQGKLRASALSTAPAWGIYHFESNPGVTWFEFAVEIFAQAKSLGLINKVPQLIPITSAEFPTPVKRPLNSKLVSNRLSLPHYGLVHWNGALATVLKQLQGDDRRRHL